MGNNHIYRFERKFYVSGMNVQQIELIVKKNPAIFSEIFTERHVNNIYFDSLSLKNYFDNVDGNTNRKKIRIRWYGDMMGNIQKPVLEIKIRNGLLGTKLSYPISSFTLEDNFNTINILNDIESIDIPDYIKMEINMCQPTLLNKYTRKYFLSADRRYRITIDTNQVFYRINPQYNYFQNRFKNDVHVILELKYNADSDDHVDKITKHFPFRLTKSSKYVTGLELVHY